MAKIVNPNIKLKENIDQNEYNDIYNLQEICLKVDQTTLKLEIDYKLSLLKGQSENLSSINEFMYYDENKLIGYIGICEFGSKTLEINGMVHPEYRRKGVFKRLYSLVKDEWCKRESKKILLLCDANSISGQEFIKKTGACYENSEYEMFLLNSVKQDSIMKNVVLRKANNKDAKEVAWQDSIYFGKEFKEEDILIPEEEEKRGSVTYMAEVDRKVIGKVRLEIIHGVGAIYGLGVIPDFRGKGYGREILTRAIEKLKENNPKEIKLQVVTENRNALNLYKSCSFEETSTMDYYNISKI